MPGLLVVVVVVAVVFGEVVVALEVVGPADEETGAPPPVPQTPVTLVVTGVLST